MRVLLDLDNVVADFSHGMRLRLGRPCVAGREHEAREPLVAAYGDCVCGPCLDDFANDPEAARRLRPVPGAIDGVRALGALGCRIVAATGRPALLEAATRAWLAAHGLDALIESLVHDGDKVRVARRHGLELAIEDNPANVEALRAAGVPTIVYGQPYNAGLARPRVRSWAEIPPLVAKHAECPAR